MSKPNRLATAGLTINVRVEGTGSPMLFLGGSNFDLSIKAPVFDSPLPDHFTVAAADPRGLGQTDQPDGHWRMQDYANDALQLIDALGWDKVDVLGESFGAMTALHLAALAPEKINRMALAAGAPGGQGGSSYPIENLRGIADPQDRAKTALGILDTRFEALLLNTPDDAQQRIQKRVEAEAAFINANQNEHGFPKLLQARAAHDCWALLPAIRIPTLIFAGRFDNQAPVDRAENMAQAMPNASLHVIEGGHAHCFMSPEPAQKIIEEWVAKN